MILYNGQRRSTGADFVSLGLVGGRLEFRSVSHRVHRAKSERHRSAPVFTDTESEWWTNQNHVGMWSSFKFSTGSNLSLIVFIYFFIYVSGHVESLLNARTTDS